MKFQKQLEFQKNFILNSKNRGKKLEFQKKIHMKFQIVREKLEFVDFSLIGPVSNPFTNYCAISLKKYYVRRKRRIKILKTICPRYCNYLGHMVFRFPICNTGPVYFFSKNVPKKPLINLLLIYVSA